MELDIWSAIVNWLEKLLKLDYWYIELEAIYCNILKTVRFVDFEWWFHWFIQQSELNWPFSRNLLSFFLNVSKVKRTENRLKKIMGTFFSGLFNFRLLSWVIDCLWLLASMIKWFQLRAVKVVVHLIDLPGSFRITRKIKTA